MNLTLFSPEIPQNVGNIARTCAVTGAKLTLIRPLSFNLSDKHLKRAGLDYWNQVEITILDALKPDESLPFYFFSTKGKLPYTEITYEKEAQLIFGSETSGLPAWVHEKWPDRIYTIPMRENSRSLNLANCAAIVLYEALRQQNFEFN